MIQNLPAMWRLYKGFQSLPAAGGYTGGIATSGTAAVSSAVAIQYPVHLLPESSSRLSDNFESMQDSVIIEIDPIRGVN